MNNPSSDLVADKTTISRPPYLTDAWLLEHAGEDGTELLSWLRPEDDVMRASTLRAIRSTRLSFSRSLIDRMTGRRWSIVLVHREIDADGAGLLAYEIEAEGHVFHFVVIARKNDGEDRTGRVCDINNDLLGTLRDGRFDREAVKDEVRELNDKVWLGRTANKTIGWTAANWSNRFFNYTVDALSRGVQPDRDFLATGGGYILRNAGWLGNGRFGSKSWLSYGLDHPFAYPYHVDIFALYLWRLAGHDVVDAMAQRRAPGAATTLSPALRRALGIGNSSGIGMVAALVRWPAWLSAYTFPRELSLAYVRSRKGAVDRAKAAYLLELMERVAKYYDEQPPSLVDELEQPSSIAASFRRLKGLVEELLASGTLGGTVPEYPWDALIRAAESYGGEEVHEQLHALLMELYPAFCDAAAALFPEAMRIKRKTDPLMTTGELADLITANYAWALDIDRTASDSQKYFWYRSEELGENRRGERAVDEGVPNETFVDVVGAVQALYADLQPRSRDMALAEFLILNPMHAHAASRVQLARQLPYTEIRANIVDAKFLPMDGIRFLLSTMGLESSHPHNTRWVRGVFLPGAPEPEDLAAGIARDWIYPTIKLAV